MPVTDRSGATPDTGESLHIIDKVSNRTWETPRPFALYKQWLNRLQISSTKHRHGVNVGTATQHIEGIYVRGVYGVAY